MKKFTEKVYVSMRYTEDLVIQKAGNKFTLYLFKNKQDVLDDYGTAVEDLFTADMIKGEFEASNYEEACQNAIACVYTYSDEFKLINDKIAGVESDEYVEYRAFVENVKSKIKPLYE